LELAVLLDRLWDRQRLSQTYNLVWVAPMVFNTVEFAKCQLEWMSGQLTEQFDSTVGHPLQLKNIRMFPSVREFELFNEERPNPICVLASGLSLEGGPARDLLVLWANNPDHAVIFTDSSQCYLRRTQSAPDVVQPSIAAPAGSNELDEGFKQDRNAGEPGGQGDIASEWTTAAQLMLAWYQAKVEGREMDDSVRVDVNVPVRSPLGGAELLDFLSREESKRREQILYQEKVAMLREVEIAKGQLRLGEHESGFDVAKSVSNVGGISSLVSGGSRPKKKSRFDSYLFMKFSKPQHCTCVTFVASKARVHSS
jgi:cleavage and polyadenylation specificity factor subunit 2